MDVDVYFFFVDLIGDVVLYEDVGRVGIEFVIIVGDFGDYFGVLFVLGLVGCNEFIYYQVVYLLLVLVGIGGNMGDDVCIFVFV